MMPCTRAADANSKHKPHSNYKPWWKSRFTSGRQQLAALCWFSAAPSGRPAERVWLGMGVWGGR